MLLRATLCSVKLMSFGCIFLRQDGEKSRGSCRVAPLSKIRGSNVAQEDCSSSKFKASCLTGVTTLSRFQTLTGGVARLLGKSDFNIVFKSLNLSFNSLFQLDSELV